MANPTNNQNNDIDLSHVTAKVKGYITGVNDSFFDGILFLKRNVIAIAIIVILGAALGYYMDSGPKRLEHKILVSPNFESADYLYEAVNLLNLKIKQRDTLFLKQIGIKNPKRFAKIDIEPIIDIYNFIDESDDEQIDDRKFEVFKVISENGEMKEVLEDPTTSKNYKNHLILIVSKGTAEQSEIVDPVMAFLNSNPHYKLMQAEYVNNVNLKLAANDTIIRQLDKMVAYFTDSSRKAGANSVYYNDNSQLAEAMKLKDKLVDEQGKLRIDKANFTDVIKQNGLMLNEKTISATTGRMKFIVPVIFFVLFVALMMFRAYYRSQVNKRKIVITE